MEEHWMDLEFAINNLARAEGVVFAREKSAAADCVVLMSEADFPSIIRLPQTSSLSTRKNLLSCESIKEGTETKSIFATRFRHIPDNN